jgi:hypothetical protein
MGERERSREGFEGIVVAYLSCPNCGLSFRVQALDLVIERCPRCLARAGRITRLLLSEEPHPVSPGRRRASAEENSLPELATGDAAPEPAV